MTYSWHQQQRQSMRNTYGKSLDSYGIKINPAKYVFGETVKFLGYLVTGEGTKPLPEKVEVIKKFPKPQTAKQLRQFLGMLNFYRRFIPKAASRIKRLTKRTEKRREDPCKMDRRGRTNLRKMQRELISSNTVNASKNRGKASSHNRRIRHRGWGSYTTKTRTRMAAIGIL
ncbi:uncharacterized protein LOC109861792 [Pseudomyrmex gracilis]|uniref:uncharacterized protein LOC109861792 n=1 Tax=Pseudomyrmex gracilis TaxID=219809 RepID=UPI000994AFF6|nr:uncharacterized protein LOC109861792 [Pseudomyrmex gracilis]